MSLPDLIFLCGFMGAGKSTLGQKLASKLSLPFLDLDEEIERKAGISIPAIFSSAGEAEFRSIEREILIHTSESFSGVVALGGGSLQNQYLLDRIKSSGLLIFIETPLSVVVQRLAGSINRPLLVDKDGNPKDKSILEKELQILYEDRFPLYKQAEITVRDDGSQSPDELVNIICKKIKDYDKHH